MSCFYALRVPAAPAALAYSLAGLHQRVEFAMPAASSTRTPDQLRCPASAANDCEKCACQNCAATELACLIA
jgi:hypothetical protein